jgi:hypothetical protein
MARDGARSPAKETGLARDGPCMSSAAMEGPSSVLGCYFDGIRVA